MNNVENVIEKVKAKKQLLEYKNQQLEETLNDKNRLIEELERIQNEKASIDNIVAACKIILEKLTYASKAKLERFLTSALQSIFTDRNYEIKLVFKEDTKKPGLELTLSEDGIDQEITDAVGGGIVSTLGLLLQIYYIEIYNLNKILFIDEGLKEVSTITTGLTESTNYLESLLQFLHWMSIEKNYAFVIITHDNSVRKFASRIYEVSKGDIRLC